MTVTLLGYTLDFLSVIGILAAIVMIVTEMVKDLWVIKKIPTKLTALIISVVVVAGHLQGPRPIRIQSFRWARMMMLLTDCRWL